MAADGALDQSLVREPVQAALLAVARCGGEHQREVARRAVSREAPLQRRDQLLGRAAADEAGASDGVAVAYQRDRLIGGNDLVF